MTRQFIEEQVAELREAMKTLAATLIELKAQMDRIELTIDSLRSPGKDVADDEGPDIIPPLQPRPLPSVLQS